MDTSSDSAPAAAATPEVDAANVAPAQYPNMDVAQKVFTATRPGAPASAREEAVALMRADSMAETYAEACAAHGWESDAALLAAMRAANAKEAERLSAALEDAKVNHGDMEVLDALVEIARLHARTGAKQAAYDALAAVVAFSKVSTGKKIEMTLDRARVGFFYNDVAGVKAALAHADKLVEDGGDWDQRNRLKVYTATLAVMQRDFKTAAGLFLECIATFTCSELFSYEQFIFFAVVTNVLHLARPRLKKEIIDGPEVLQVTLNEPELAALGTALYGCEYRAFFEAMLAVVPMLEGDRYLSQHTMYLVRELRVLVYGQYLQAYQSVLLSAMAAAFGVSEAFLDKELSRFIAAGRISAKIDKVGGMAQTNRPDLKNAQYQAVIKKGDTLLNSVQRLARVVDV